MCSIKTGIKVNSYIEKLKSNMKVLCTICARGGSQGLKNKNIKLIKKRPLILYYRSYQKKSKLFDKIVVSTDSKNSKNF